MLRRPKILFYSGHCEIVGGDAKYLFELVNGLNPDKYDVVVCTDKNHVFQERALQWLKREVPIEYLNTRPELFKRGFLEMLVDGSICGAFSDGFWCNMAVRVRRSPLCFWSVRLLRKMIRLLSLTELHAAIHNCQVFWRMFRRHQPIDIVHFNNGGYLGKIAGLWAIMIARVMGIPHTIMTIQNLPATKGFRPSDYFFDLMMGRCCSRFIPVSFKLKDKMVENRGLPTDNILPIYHGLEDTDRFTEDHIRQKRATLGVGATAPLIMIVSNIDEDRKGHRVLFESLITVRKEFPDVVLLVVGDGAMRPLFEDLARKMGLSESIRFLGHRSDIAELNESIDIATVPSIAFEGIPYTIREAMRSAKAVVTTDAGGCDEAVIHGVNGYVVAQGDTVQLSEALLKLLRDPQLRGKMAQESRRLFEEKFLLQDKIQEHEQIYDKLLAAGCRREAACEVARV